MIDDDFKDLEERQYDVSNRSLLTILIASIIVLIFHNLNINAYFKNVIVPFTVVLISYIIIFKDEKKNKKAYFMLIPIVLILISDLIIGIDDINKYLNIGVLSVIMTMFIFLLLNSNYKIVGKSFLWIFKLFPIGIFTNLQFFRLNIKDQKSKKANNIFIGTLFGLIFGAVIMALLTQADDYFNAFIKNTLESFDHFDISNVVIFVLTFIFLFSVLINILKNKDKKMGENKSHDFDKSLVITFLSIVNVVFVLFLVSEISRLTVNFLNVPVEYTYSSYAREGFFQLLYVTIINFAIIMFLLYKSKVNNEKSIKILISLLICFSIILIFNSYYRMFLYINHFGFTTLRMQVILFLLMELIIFTLLIFKVFDKFKKNNAFIYFIIAISFYIINLYVCNDFIINLISSI